MEKQSDVVYFHLCDELVSAVQGWKAVSSRVELFKRIFSSEDYDPNDLQIRSSLVKVIFLGFSVNISRKRSMPMNSLWQRWFNSDNRAPNP